MTHITSPVNHILIIHHSYSLVCVCCVGGGKRKGAFAIYLEPWHADILAFLDLKKNHGIEEVIIII